MKAIAFYNLIHLNVFEFEYSIILIHLNIFSVSYSIM